MILILSSTDKISGAEHVLKDYLEFSELIDKISICSTNENINKFYSKIEKIEVIKNDNISQVRFSKNIKVIFKELIKYIRFYSFLLKNKNRMEVGVGNNTLDSIYSIYFFRNKIPFILFIHDTISLNSYRAKLLKYTNKYTDKYIAVSFAVKNQLIKIGIPDKKIEVVYNGLLPEKINIKNKNTILKIAFIGRIDYGKNPELYCEIIKIIKKMNINYEASIIYNGYDENILKQINEINHHNHLNIKFMKNLSREEVQKYLKAIDFLVVTSRSDSLPTVILEAFKNGTPVIGIECDGIPEMIDNKYNGFLFKEAKEFEKILREINELSNEQYIELSQNSNKTIMDKFNLNDKVKHIDNIIRGAIKNEIN